jgi:hypothetical protein
MLPPGDPDRGSDPYRSPSHRAPSSGEQGGRMRFRVLLTALDLDDLLHRLDVRGIDCEGCRRGAKARRKAAA